MIKQPIIVTFSGKARAGKDSSCQFLKEQLQADGYRVMQINYADYLKFICSKYFGWDGEKDEKGRTLLQQVGTEKVRTHYPNYWVHAVINMVKAMMMDYDFILIGDCRFPNEITEWRSRGVNYSVCSVNVIRPGHDNGLTDEQKAHKSENALNNFNFDYVISASNLEQLRENISHLKTKLVLG